jgi:putative ABC transport system substrate-binding protein
MMLASFSPATLGQLALTLALLLTDGTASPRPWRLGVFFWHDSPNDALALKGVTRALEESGRSHELITRQAHADRAEAERQVEELRDAHVDLVFAMGTEAALIAAEHVKDLPVIFTAVTNPVESQVVGSWRGSGRNIAGNSNWIPSETVLHVFRLAVPKLRKLGVLRSRDTGVVSGAELRSMREHLERAGDRSLELEETVVASAEELAPAVAALAGKGCDAIWIPIDFFIYEHMDAIVPAAQQSRIPLVSSSMRGAKAGAIAGVLVDYELLGMRAAAMALDVLEREAPPGAIPVGLMAGYQLVVNLGAAKRCGHELPLSLLAVADVLLEDSAQKDGS